MYNKLYNVVPTQFQKNLTKYILNIFDHQINDNSTNSTIKFVIKISKY